MKRASYRDGIFWIAANDDTEWVDHDPEVGGGAPSVTACLLADLFGVDTERVRADVIKQRAKIDRKTP
jgi:hypothetical protein